MKYFPYRMYVGITAVLFGAIFLYIGVYLLCIRPFDTNFRSVRRSPIISVQDISVGYTLISPYNNFLNADPKNKGTVLLLDLTGRAVHTWTTEKQTLSAQLTPDGYLLAAMEPRVLPTQFPGGGNTGVIAKLDWKSNIVWTYENERMHHDFVQLPNGNLVVALWEKLPHALNRRILGGIPGTELNGDVWSDEVAEINADKQVVWSWHAYDHLNPEIDRIDPALARAGWTYINGISYVARNPIDGTEGFLISMRTLDTIFLVRKKDGAVLWRSPKGLFNTQHDPNMLENGNVVAFDNGFVRPPVPFTLYGSRVVEINPKMNRIEWEFNGGPSVMDKLAFFGPLVGGAQPLPNGNTLVTVGSYGHVIELTKDNTVVWDLISPYVTKQTGSFPVNFIFKARRYTQEQVQFPEFIPPAVRTKRYAVYTALRKYYPRILQ